ncbi:MAG: hypothetical protein MUO78_08095, partial [candidate division Zixibacteria bacterium]|nr:hypothetical protein [candidate division Zixibacteria bacterium]
VMASRQTPFIRVNELTLYEAAKLRKIVMERSECKCQEGTNITWKVPNGGYTPWHDFDFSEDMKTIIRSGEQAAYEELNKVK